MKRKHDSRGRGRRFRPWSELGSGKMVLIVAAGVISAVAVGLTVYGAVVPAKSGQGSGSPAPSAGAGASAAPTAAPVAPSTLNIAELKAKFKLPASLHDLEYQVVQLPGDTEITSVEFGSKGLDGQGCRLSSAPLGYLTSDSDQGGQYVSTVDSQPMFYLDPTHACASHDAAVERSELVKALAGLDSDGR